MNLRNPLLITVLAVLVAGFGVYHFGLQPKRQEAKDLDAKIATAQSDLDAAQAELAGNLDAQRTFKASYASVVRLGKAVPGDDDVRSLVVQLDRAAKRTHVDFQSIEVTPDTSGVSADGTDAAASGPLPPGASVGTAGFPVMPFTFTFRGGFFRLSTYLHRLDAFVRRSNHDLSVNGRLLTVDGIKLEPDTTGFPNIKATVAATSYLVPAIEGPTGGATAAGPAGTTATGAGTAGSPGSTVPTTTATIR